NLNSSSYFDAELLDNELAKNTDKLNLTLRVPYKMKGSVNHMLIPSELRFTTQGNQVKLSLVCSFTKPVIISLIFGLIPSMLSLITQSNIFAFLLLVIIISGITFSFIYFQIEKTSSQCLQELKRVSIKK